MSVLNLENAKWLIATLAIPAALGLVAHQYQQSQAERQIADARLRLYTELLSKREEADTAVRRGIFDKVLERNLAPGDQGRSEEHTSELQSRFDLVCRLLLEKKNSTSVTRDSTLIRMH